MAKCKMCQTKLSIWGSDTYGDGLCKTCLDKTLAEVARKKQQALADAKAMIDSIVKSLIGDEQPLCVAFFHSGVQQKSSGFLKKLPGMIAGVAIGGQIGEMVFGGSMLSDKATYAGELDLLVVTARRLVLGHCADTPFMSASAEISPEHLQLLEAQCKAKTIGRLEWSVSSSQVSETDPHLTIVNGGRKFHLIKSELYVNGAIHQTPSVQDVCKQISQLGTRATPIDFATKLLAGEDPLSDGQVAEAVADKAYMKAISDAIITHGQRDALVHKMTALAPSLKAAVERQLRARAEAYNRTLITLLVWAVLAMGSVAGIVSTEEFARFLCVVGTIVTTVGSIVYLVKLSRSAWCRTVMKA
ncbi:MAG: hypothetical protein KBA18_13655 [Kiritimatiellae bacterium]|nr:hypothetical protein [Kiritimatiellia bacterium]